MDKYAVIINRTIHHEGDERSRKNPGHGYPAYSENVQELKTFANYDEFVKWVEAEEKWQGSRKDFAPIKYTELEIVRTTQISIK